MIEVGLVGIIIVMQINYVITLNRFQIEKPSKLFMYFMIIIKY